MTAKWCKHCRKHVAWDEKSADVSAAASACPDCGQPTSRFPRTQLDDSNSEFSLGEDPTMPVAASRLKVGEFSFDSWEIEQDLLDAERVIASERRTQQKRAEQINDEKQQAQTARDAAKKRLPSHLRPDFATIQSLAVNPLQVEPVAYAPQPEICGDSFLAWCCRALGYGALAFGAALVACAWMFQRIDLGSLGVPMIVLGVAGLIVSRLMRPQPSAPVVPIAAPWQGMPQPHLNWASKGYLSQSFFAPPQPGMPGPPSFGPMPNGEPESSRQMLSEMKSRIEQLAAKIEAR